MVTHEGTREWERGERARSQTAKEASYYIVLKLELYKLKNKIKSKQ